MTLELHKNQKDQIILTLVWDQKEKFKIPAKTIHWFFEFFPLVPPYETMKIKVV